MPSPFPGMDPFVEHPFDWKGVHLKLISHLQDAILAGLPTGYDCRVEADLYLHELSGEERGSPVRPTGPAAAVADGGVVASAGGVSGSGAAAVLDAPVRHAVEASTAVLEYEHPFLEVTDRDGERVVCVLELLSPTNESGPDRAAYLRKRDRLLYSETHLVEIDLLRTGRRMPIRGPIEEPYLVMVSQAGLRPAAGEWPFGLRDPFPTVPVPLSGDDPPVWVDLGAVFANAYDRGGFARRSYRRPPEPPLDPADAEWAAGLLTAADIPLPAGFPPPAGAAGRDHAGGDR